MNRQRAAFLRVVRDVESNQTDGAFRLLVYGGAFDSFADHPRIHFDIATRHRVENWKALPPNSTTSAAGAFQIVETTWDAFCKATGYAGPFDEAGQTACAEWLMGRRRVLDDVDAGRLDVAIYKCADEWEGLRGIDRERAARTFRQFGGWVQGDVEAPPVLEPEPTPAPVAVPAPSTMGEFMPLLLSLLPLVLQLFAPKVQSALTKASDNPAGAEQLVQMLIGKGAELVGVPPSQPVQVVAALQKMADDAAKVGQRAPAVEALETSAVEWLQGISPMLDKLAAFEKQAAELTMQSQDAAAARADAKDLRPLLAKAIWAAMGAISAGLMAAIVVQVSVTDAHKADPELILAFSTLVTYMLARLGDVYGYAFGGTQKAGAAESLAGAIKATQPTK